MNARSLDVVPNDVPLVDVVGDDTLDACRVHPTIQSRRTPRAGDRRKPATERRHRRRGEDLPHQDIGPLRAATEAALPRELGVLARTMALERTLEHVVQPRGSEAASALRAATDHDLETTYHAP